MTREEVVSMLNSGTISTEDIMEYIESFGNPSDKNVQCFQVLQQTGRIHSITGEVVEFLCRKYQVNRLNYQNGQVVCYC